MAEDFNGHVGSNAKDYKDQPIWRLYGCGVKNKEGESTIEI